jgi:Rps23 Pro-64 3,4-dihydroxylase Tpa1-like proline 4-hydroxylase
MTHENELLNLRVPSISDLINWSLIEEDRLDQDVAAIKESKPFPYLVLERLFSEDLLQAVANEFDTHDGWRTIDNHGQRIHRSLNSERFGPATEAYLAAANSARFVSYLRALSGFPHLIADAMAERGGLHETKRGGFLKVHRDFADHKGNDLKTALVVITYLNKEWKSEYLGDLELWDQDRCVVSIPPSFGRTVILLNPHRSLHGHPAPLLSPDGVARRSVATYYYTNPRARTYERPSTRFLELNNAGHYRFLVRRWVPHKCRAALSAAKSLFQN